MICIVYVHISWCHNYPHDILVHIQAGEIATYTEKRLSECVEKAWDKKETTEAECDLVKEKARELKWLLVPGVEMCDDELEDLAAEIEYYKKSMQVAEKELKASTSAFMAAHATTLEVLGEVGKVEYKHRFHSKVPGDMKCMFCRMAFSSAELWKRHIISCHWAIFEDTVSISYTCCKFLYNNVIATVYASASLYGFLIYESMYLCGTCDIVHFSIL